MRSFRIFVFGLFIITCCISPAAFRIYDLKTDYAEEPLGIENPSPVFSWKMINENPGAKQEGYEIRITDDNGDVVWDSGFVNSDLSNSIKYEGKNLNPRTCYNWQLKVIDNKGDMAESGSFFETGIMSANENSPLWEGAQWIGGDKSSLPFNAFYIPVFQIQFDLRFHEDSNEADFIYGAGDPRLPANSNITLRFSLRDGDNDFNPVLSVFSNGYGFVDDGNPMALFEVSDSLINESNQFKSHKVNIKSVTGKTTLFLDGQELGEINLNPAGEGGDYPAYPLLGDIGFSSPEGEKVSFENIEIKNYRHPYHTISAVPHQETEGETIIVKLPETGLTMLRSELTTSKSVKKARLYMTSRGVYDFFINGERVTENYLNPGLTQYNKTHNYQVFDVTGLIKEGPNAMGAILGEGWWSGPFTFSAENWNYWGDKQSLFGYLTVDYGDGTRDVFATTPDNWKWTNDGPYRYGSIFQGEVYDATREEKLKGWSLPGFDDTDWSQAEIVELDETISKALPSPGFISWPSVDNYDMMKLTSQTGNSIVAGEGLTALDFKEIDGRFIYDMGQNFAGVPRIIFRDLQPGTEVILKFAEVLYPDLDIYEGKQGELMTENLRAAKVEDKYIAKGGYEIYQPRFTYHGYRFVELDGLNKPLPLEDVKGQSLSSIDKLTLNFKTDNEKLNRFIENIKWSSLSNIFSVPTDCPQRNERMGWSGDLSVFVPSLSYIFNGANFFRSHLNNIHDCISEEGVYPAIAPVGGGFGGPLWESVGVVIPWQSYLKYGDKETLGKYYPDMKRYVDYVLNNYIDHATGFYKSNDLFPGLGDWLGFELSKNDDSMIFDCYLVYELDIMKNAAEVLGLYEDFEYWETEKEKRKEFISSNYFDENGKTIRYRDADKPVDTQTSYALPLVFDILPENQKALVAKNLVKSVKRESVGDDGSKYPENSLMTGFIGTAWISQALSTVDCDSVAYDLLFNEKFPSWLYPLTLGATTIWERLNSMTKEDGMGGNNHMNSFNHYAYGSVLNWMINTIAGINPDKENPGFKHFYLNPVPDLKGRINEAEAEYESPYGKIRSKWNISDDREEIKYEFDVPANTSATLRLPGEKSMMLESGSHTFLRKLPN